MDIKSSSVIVSVVACLFTATVNFQNQNLVQTDLQLHNVVEKGEHLFYQNCASCHFITKELVGPPLANVEKRMSKHKIYAFMKDPFKLIRNDDYTKKLYEKYKIMHPPFDFSRKEVNEIISFVNKKVKKNND